MLSISSVASVQKIGPVEVGEDGAPIAVTLEDALSICSDKGMTLPTILEYATLSELENKLEIQETRYLDSSIKKINGSYDKEVSAEIKGMNELGFGAIYHKNTLGEKAVWFYVRSNIRPNPISLIEPEQLRFWALDLSSDDNNTAYIFNEHRGLVYWIPTMVSTDAAVRCVPKRINS